MMFKAGRMDRIQSDQAKTDLLTARQTVITTEKSYLDALDNFKITLGLAPEAPVALKDEELESLQAQMESLAKDQPDALSDYPSLDDAMNIALVERRDLAVTRGDVVDAERAVMVAADALRADITVEGGASYNAKRRQHKDSVDETIATTRAHRARAVPPLAAGGRGRDQERNPRRLPRPRGGARAVRKQSRGLQDRLHARGGERPVHAVGTQFDARHTGGGKRPPDRPQRALQRRDRLAHERPLAPQRDGTWREMVD